MTKENNNDKQVIVNRTLSEKLIDLAKAIIGVEFKKLIVILIFLGFIAWLLFEYEIIGYKKHPEKSFYNKSENEKVNNPDFEVTK